MPSTLSVPSAASFFRHKCMKNRRTVWSNAIEDSSKCSITSVYILAVWQVSYCTHWTRLRTDCHCLCAIHHQRLVTIDFTELAKRNHWQQSCSHCTALQLQKSQCHQQRNAPAGTISFRDDAYPQKVQIPLNCVRIRCSSIVWRRYQWTLRCL